MNDNRHNNEINNSDLEEQIKIHSRMILGRKYFSQAGQDLFALLMLSDKSNGFYIEIGGADPFESNNTFLLENFYSWKGFSIEFDKKLASRFNDYRKNPCICSDATNFDYKKMMQDLNFPLQVDYLSVDIDPAENTYMALKKCPFESYRFSVITFEHDLYASGTHYAELSREFLRGKGYQLVAKNVKCFDRVFEDWWVDPRVVPEALYQRYACENVEFSEILDFKK